MKHKKKYEQEEEEQGRKRRKRHGDDDRVGVDDRRSPLEALHSRLQCRHRSCVQRGRKLCQPVHTIHLGIHPLHHFQSAATSANWNQTCSCDPLKCLLMKNGFQPSVDSKNKPPTGHAFIFKEPLLVFIAAGCLQCCRITKAIAFPSR